MVLGWHREKSTEIYLCCIGAEHSAPTGCYLSVIDQPRVHQLILLVVMGQDRGNEPTKNQLLLTAVALECISWLIFIGSNESMPIED